MCGTCIALGQAEDACHNTTHAMDGPVAAGSGSTTVTDETALLHYMDGGTNFRWNALSSLGTSVVVTYSFNKGEGADNPYNASSFSAYTEAQRTNFRAAANEFMAVSGVILLEVSSGGMIDVYRAHGTGTGGYADIPWVSNYWMPDVDVVVDMNGNYDVGGYGYHTILHEIGHGVGLAHTHDGAYTLAANLDSTKNTVMSYNYDASAYGLQYLDVAALQDIYGTTVTSGFIGKSASGTRAVLEGDGTGNTFVVPNGAGNTVVDVKIFGRDGNDYLTGNSGSDKLRGNNGNDELNGGAGDDFLRGGSGNDTLNGGTGDDYLNGGTDDDVLNGDANQDTLLGRIGDDTLDGGSGNDTLDGGIDNDVLTGGSGTDRFVFLENSGDDTITDFNASGEILDFSGTGHDFGDVTISSVVGGTLVQVGSASVMLDGVTSSQITIDDFFFGVG